MIGLKSRIQMLFQSGFWLTVFRRHVAKRTQQPAANPCEIRQLLQLFSLRRVVFTDQAKQFVTRSSEIDLSLLIRQESLGLELLGKSPGRESIDDPFC